MAPQYLQDLITLHPVARLGLRSGKSFQQLAVPFTKRNTLAHRAVGSVIPRWCKPGSHGHQKVSIDCFKANLKP